MSVLSMTGYGQAKGDAFGLRWNVEIKSVNGRGLDIRCRIPSVMEPFEAAIRELIAASIQRGNINVSVSLEGGTDIGELVINRKVLDQYVAVARELVADNALDPGSAVEMLALRGVAEFKTTDLSQLEQKELLSALKTSFAAALIELNKVRQAEGARLADHVKTLVQKIETLVSDADRCAALQPAKTQERLLQSLDGLLENVSLDQDRLAQEVALLATKADVLEELERLKVHVSAAYKLLGSDNAIGRSFDFLAQEFFRETNTLCSKSSDVELTRIGLDLKSVIEQMREQVRNLE